MSRRFSQPICLAIALTLTVQFIPCTATAADLDQLVDRANGFRTKVQVRYTKYQDKLTLKGLRFQEKIDGSDAEKQEALRAKFQEKIDLLIARLQERADSYKNRMISRIQDFNEQISETDPTRVVSTTGLDTTFPPITLTAVSGGGGGGGGGTGGTGLGGGSEGTKLLTERHCYILQPDGLGERAAAIGKIAAVNADTFILDAYFDPPEDAGQFTSTELDQIRAGGQVMGGSRSRVILAYLSIGEAEDYRPYWMTEWDTDGDGQLTLDSNGNVAANVPDWLLNKNKQFPDNYLVKYWDAEWQGIIFGSATSSLDRIIAQGFDGVYLDIVDGFENFDDGDANAVNPVTGKTYRRDMVDFIKALTAYARAQKPNFLIVPQNGSELLVFPDYLDIVSGQGKEDLYYSDNAQQSEDDIATHKAELDTAKAQGKAVLVTDYPTRSAKQTQAFNRAAQDGYSMFIGVRDLNTIGKLP